MQTFIINESDNYINIFLDNKDDIQDMKKYLNHILPMFYEIKTKTQSFNDESFQNYIETFKNHHQNTINNLENNHRNEIELMENKNSCLLKQKENEIKQLNEKIGKIYVIRNKITNDTYIGSTKVPLLCRFAEHITSWSKRKKYNCILLANAFHNIGIDNFYIELLENVNIDKNNIRKIEQKWIDLLNPTLNKQKAFRSIQDKRDYDKKEYENLPIIECQYCGQHGKSKYIRNAHSKTKKCLRKQ